MWYCVTLVSNYAASSKTQLSACIRHESMNLTDWPSIAQLWLGWAGPRKLNAHRSNTFRRVQHTTQLQARVAHVEVMCRVRDDVATKLHMSRCWLWNLRFVLWTTKPTSSRKRVLIFNLSSSSCCEFLAASECWAGREPWDFQNLAFFRGRNFSRYIYIYMSPRKVTIRKWTQL